MSLTRPEPAPSPERHQGHALCVDLDGTLLNSDILYESLLALLARNPLYIFLLPLWLLRGKAALKRELARRVTLAPEHMPYNQHVLDMLSNTPQRPRVLCSASDLLLVKPIAEHLGLFEEVIASEGAHNLAGHRKADALVARLGERCFDYVANDKIDLQVWRHAAGAVVVSDDAALAHAASLETEVLAVLPSQHGGLRSWVKALRLYQWLKNLLILVPLLTAHLFLEPKSIVAALAAFLAFGLCASGVYLLNDLLDLASDRQHPRKRNRPFAAGTLPLLHGMVATPVLTLAGFALALWVNSGFALVLLTYFVITLAYSFKLKRTAILDVVVLAALYTVRIVGGAAAIESELSFWLLAFSMFIFLSLALLKRYTELEAMARDGKHKIAGRGYSAEDVSLIQSMGTAAGYISTMVFALYINSSESMALYTHPKVLWLLCPVLLYWIGRVWMVAHRGEMHDDPIVFAATDRTSQIIIALGALIVLLAI